MKKFLVLFALIFSLNTNVFAEGEDQDNEQIAQPEQTINSFIENKEIFYDKTIFLGKEYLIDLSSFLQEIKDNFPDEEITFEWNNGNSTLVGPIFKNIYEKVGEKMITLNIYKNIEVEEKTEKEVIFTKNIKLFVYDKLIPIVVSKDIPENSLNDLVSFYVPYGINLDVLGYLSKQELEVYSILTKFDEFKKKEGKKSDYMIIWGERDFTFDIISKLNREIELSKKDEKINLYVFTSFNLDILSTYLGNFLANKNWINKLLITPEQSRFKITTESLNINNVIEGLKESMFEYIDVDLKGTGILKFLPFSKFVNTFSNLGFDTNSIYIIILIPFMLALISFFKHFIGLSTMGILPPLFLMILSIKLGLGITMIFFVSLVVLNILFLRFVGNFNMLYIPKVSLLVSVNLMLYMIALVFLIDLKVIDLTITDSLYLLLFVVISERFLSSVVSKELSSYKEPLLVTIFVAIVGYGIFVTPGVKTFILSFPEIIILTLPILFLIGRFTGLRVTEYFRFREVIKSVEE